MSGADHTITWLREVRRRDIRGFKKVEWQRLIEDEIDPIRNVGMERGDLANAAAPWLGKLDSRPFRKLAILDVVLDGPRAVADLHDYVVVPAIQRGIELVIVADRDLPELEDRAFHEPEFGYAYSLDRLRWRLSGQMSPIGPVAQVPDSEFIASPAQAAAIGARTDGAVQIIAPAGSGKTAVLIERVRALRQQGVPSATIVCLTFNAEAKKEMDRRLQAAELDVEALTFHGLGRRIAISAKRLPRHPRPGGLPLSQWRRICALARRETGLWIDPAEAKKLLSDIKLRDLLSAEQYAEHVADSKDPQARAMAVVYRAYHQTQQDHKNFDCDFDDFLLYATQALRDDAGARATWQSRYHHVLVDEYQDIEPAQELIVRMIAAPQDQMFCVGDEDQTLYAFRRASVERIICLDGAYPGLQRVQLDINYRCPKRIVTASKHLIDVNRVRFPKTITSAPGRPDRGKVTLNGVTSHMETATRIAALLKDKQRGQITVLSRTTNGLRSVAYACAEEGIKIDGPDKLFATTGALRALQDHLDLTLHPAAATNELVRRVCSVPARHVSNTEVADATRKLRAGKSFAVAFASISAPARDGGKIWAPDKLFTALALLAGVTFAPDPGAMASHRRPAPANYPGDWHLDDEHLGPSGHFDDVDYDQPPVRSLGHPDLDDIYMDSAGPFDDAHYDEEHLGSLGHPDDIDPDEPVRWPTHPDLIDEFMAAPGPPDTMYYDEPASTQAEPGAPADVLEDVKDVLQSLGIEDLRQEPSMQPNAEKLIELLRGPGGLDAWFDESDQLGGADSFEKEFLEYAELEATGMTPPDYAALLHRRQDKLNEARDEKNGIELLTSHGAKGLQWPEVIVIGCNDGMLPNSRALRVSAEAKKRGEGLEAERRIAYVAFTRAQEHLQIFYDPNNYSDFLEEAGLITDTGNTR